jgi:hypothetical protein
MPRKEFVAFTRLDASDVNTYLMDQSIMTFANSAARGSAIATPVEGMVSYLEDTNSYQFYDGSAWTGLVPQSGNAIINGAFDIWQRGTSFSATGFYADRWLEVGGGGGTITATRESFTPAELVANNFGEGSFYLRHQRSGGTFAIIQQRVEDVRTFSGQTVTLSYYAKVASGTADNTPQIIQNFGSGGTASVTKTGETKTITTTWQRFTHTFTLDSTSGKTIGANSYLDIRPLRHVSGTGATINIWGVQLEAGSVATPFKRNANSLQGELAACQRYYYRNTATAAGNYLGFGTAYLTTGILGSVFLPVQMRVAPTSLDFSSLRVFDGANAAQTVTAAVFSQPTPQVVTVELSAAGLTQFRPYFILANTAPSFIGFSAEL